MIASREALRDSLALYAVLPEGLGEDDLEDLLEAAILGGAGFAQLREKGMDAGTYATRARRLAAAASRHGIPLVVNDSVEAAIASGSAGAHVGQSDCDAIEARRRLGPGAILGASVSGVSEALAAERAGADYLGVGAVFPTSTKPDAGAASLALLSEICASVSIPVVAIGGITAESARRLSGTGVSGIAVVSALFGPAGGKYDAARVFEAARELRAAADGLRATRATRMTRTARTTREIPRREADE